jgi:hypothetical protein
MDVQKRARLIELGTFEVVIYPEVGYKGYGPGLQYTGELYSTAEPNVPMFYSDTKYDTQEEVVYELKRELREEIYKLELEQEAGVERVRFETKDLYPTKKDRSFDWLMRFTQAFFALGMLALFIVYVLPHLTGF